AEVVKPRSDEGYVRVVLGQSIRRDRNGLPCSRAVALGFQGRGRAALSDAVVARTAARRAVRARRSRGGLRGRQTVRVHARLGAYESRGRNRVAAECRRDQVRTLRSVSTS